MSSAGVRIELGRIAAEPWQNGAGTTRVLASGAPSASPLASAAHSGPAFDWRVSIAEVAHDAPFSRYPGIDRCIALLHGAGMRLRSTSGGAIDHALTQRFEPFRFDGEAEIEAALVDGACADFNVMTRRGVFTSEVRCLRGAAELPSAAATLLWCVAGRWQVRGDRTLSLGPDEGWLWRTPVPALHVRPEPGDGAPGSATRHTAPASLEGHAAPALLAVRLCHDPSR